MLVIPVKASAAAAKHQCAKLFMCSMKRENFCIKYVKKIPEAACIILPLMSVTTSSVCAHHRQRMAVLFNLSHGSVSEIQAEELNGRAAL